MENFEGGTEPTVLILGTDDSPYAMQSNFTDQIQ